VLKGFNLTSILVQQLFAYMDPHKKGYLTQVDWINTFSNYYKFKDVIGGINHNGFNIDEVYNVFQSSFNNVTEAFNYM
jgi:hypothetical protein